MQKTAKVNDTIDLDQAAGMVGLPDGSVATVRGSYTVRTEGAHVFYDTAGEKLATVNVKAQGEK